MGCCKCTTLNIICVLEFLLLAATSLGIGAWWDQTKPFPAVLVMPFCVALVINYVCIFLIYFAISSRDFSLAIPCFIFKVLVITAATGFLVVRMTCYRDEASDTVIIPAVTLFIAIQFILIGFEVNLTYRAMKPKIHKPVQVGKEADQFNHVPRKYLAESFTQTVNEPIRRPSDIPA